MTWTEDMVAQLKEHHAKGLSASQIARKIGGVSRNAVMGKLHRLGILRFRRVNDSPVNLTRRIDMRTKNIARRAPIRKKPKAFKLVPVLRTATAAPALNVGLLQLEPGMCRWPTNDDRPHRFCGHPWHGEKGPYCEAHMAIAHVPTLQKNIRVPSDHWDGSWKTFGMWNGEKRAA